MFKKILVLLAGLGLSTSVNAKEYAVKTKKLELSPDFLNSLTEEQFEYLELQLSKNSKDPDELKLKDFDYLDMDIIELTSGSDDHPTTGTQDLR